MPLLSKIGCSALLLLLSANILQAQTIRTICNGPWDDPTIWDLQQLPQPGDSIILEHLVNFDSDKILTDVDMLVEDYGGLCGDADLELVNSSLLCHGYLVWHDFTVESSRVTIQGTSNFTFIHVFGAGAQYSVNSGGSTVVSHAAIPCLDLEPGQPAIFRTCNNTLHCNLKADRYEWLVDGSLLPDDAAVIPFSTFGNYAVRAIDTLANDTAVSELYELLGPPVCAWPTGTTVLLPEHADMRVYPTLATHFINIDTDETIAVARLIGSDGRSVSVNPTVLGTTHQLAVAHLASGPYVLAITTASGKLHTERILVVRQ